MKRLVIEAVQQILRFGWTRKRNKSVKWAVIVITLRMLQDIETCTGLAVETG